MFYAPTSKMIGIRNINIESLIEDEIKPSLKISIYGYPGSDVP